MHSLGLSTHFVLHTYICIVLDASCTIPSPSSFYLGPNIVCRRRRYPKIFLWVQHLLELRHRRLGYLPGIAQLRCEYLIGWMNWYVARAALVQFLHIEDDGQGQANVHEELERDWPEKIRNTFSCQWFFLFLHIVFFYILFEIFF